ncbi:hypothetical protein ACFQ0X_43645 [Streptomyces rectiviolaceus]|uniref:Uncharacterized protein n=1 Tax=Streptomyces rectiviolaceus TaxID=332591 RepID=A0ABP6NMX7_9ACTN
MAILKRTVFVRDPVRHRDVILRAGEEPAPEYAALVTNPACWEDGKLPDTATTDSTESSDTSDGDAANTETKQAAPAAKKTATKKAASTPARGRNAADEGTSGT